MKKIITLFLLIVAVNTTLFSQVFTYTSNELSIDYKDGNGYHVYPIEQKIILNFDKDLIEIDSLEVFNVNYVDRIDSKKYTLLKCYSYDSSGRYCTVYIYMYSKSMYIKIDYWKFAYKYKIIYK